MPITISLSLLPVEAADTNTIRAAIAKESGLPQRQIVDWKVKKRTVDARSRQPKVVLTLAVQIFGDTVDNQLFQLQLQQVTGKKEILIVGAGPAGLFAALRAIELGMKPVVLERGKDVRTRRRDLAAMNKEGIVNPESNYCFGEGGAGTYSDGKLYTRSNKRGDIQRILNIFHHFGASEDICYEAHPHIGTNKLPQIITAMREQIIACGGEVHFNTQVTGITVTGDRVRGVQVAGGGSLFADAVVLATGHSARDVFTMLHRQGIEVECKPFALGVRIEHPQLLVDQAQYHAPARDPYLPPASYSLVSQENGRGVFSFCMCPGGIIAPAATAHGEIVVNGWSPSKRNNPYANSGTVVTVDEADFAHYGFTGPLAAMHYQQMVEQAAFAAGGGKLVAPAQRLVDFVDKRTSSTLPACSYLPGLTTVQMQDVLPIAVTEALRKAVATFGKKMKGYLTNEAVMVATESRTSSPVRIPRNRETLMHTTIQGLYPCAEGAGYAGGIVSAAMDGERCMEMAIKTWYGG